MTTEDYKLIKKYLKVVVVLIFTIFMFFMVEIYISDYGESIKKDMLKEKGPGPVGIAGAVAPENIVIDPVTAKKNK